MSTSSYGDVPVSAEPTEPLAGPVGLPDELRRRTELPVRALYLGERIDLRRLTAEGRLASHPLLITTGPASVAVLFRYGVVVHFNASREIEAALLQDVQLLTSDPCEKPETEELTLRVAPSQREEITADVVSLHELSVERLQIVATALSKSVVLAEYETRVAKNFDRVEPFAVELQSRGLGGRNMRRLLEQIGSTLLTEHKMVGRVEIREKPELVWEHPDLGPLYLQLEQEYEIRERSAALDKKLELTSRTVETVLKLLYNRRSLRVEWYIVALIVLEICLTLYDMFFRS